MVKSVDSPARLWVEECSRLRTLRRGILARGMNRNHRGKTRAKRVLQGMPGVEHDLDRNSLHHLGKVPGGVIGRQQSKLRSAGRRDLDHLPMEDDSREGIDSDICRVSYSHVGKLSFFIVGLDPHISPDQVNDLLSRRNQLTLAYVAFPDCACRRGEDAGIAQVHFGNYDVRLFGLDIRLIKVVLGIEGGALSLRGFDRSAAAGKRGFCAGQTGLLTY